MVSVPIYPARVPIAAIATAPGRGGIGVVRVSGPDLDVLIQAVCGRALTPRHAHYLPFLDAAGKAIDHGLALLFPAPHSYTGETVLELQGHGGPVVMRLLLARVLEVGRELGLRLAEPGEFTQRAYLNDRMDLAQAEAVADLIDASTEAAARSAARSLDGEFSRRVTSLVDALTHLRMLVEATLDFPEEDIDFIRQHDAQGKLDAVRARLAEVMAASRQGALLRTGMKVVLAGRPNVGKSSLLNALAGAEVAIVTPVAGTTRDRVVQQVQIEGIPLDIVDTAGLRATDDEVERIGIERTWQEVARADVVLRLSDAASPGEAPELACEILARAPRGVPVVDVVNKIDLVGEEASATDTMVRLSAREGRGIELLRARLLQIAGWQADGQDLILARERHLEALREAQVHLDGAHAQVSARMPALELFAEELRLAQQALARITGEFTSDDLLGVIFGKFCIGK